MWSFWIGYVENVDVRVKIVYKPAIEALITDLIIEPHNIDSGVEALLFAICFATATALSLRENACGSFEKGGQFFSKDIGLHLNRR